MFVEEQFPTCISYGSSSEPLYSVSVLPTANNREKRFGNFVRALVEFSCTIGPQLEDLVAEVLNWWHAMGGRECGFRFKDWTDYKSCAVGSTPAMTDCPLSPAGPNLYTLVKLYTASLLPVIGGTTQQFRPILKPVEGTLLLAYNGAAIEEGTDYTVDYTTGTITVTNGSLTDGSLFSWGGEFDVPVRFNSELPIQVVEQEIQSVQFSLMELQEPNGADVEGESGGSP